MRFPNLHAGQLHDLQRRQDELRLSPQARQRLEWLIYLSEHRHSISNACRHFGIARTTLHRWIDRFNPHDPLSLEERSHHPTPTHYAGFAPLPPAPMYPYVQTFSPYQPPAGAMQQPSVPSDDGAKSFVASHPTIDPSVAHPAGDQRRFATEFVQRVILALALIAIGWMIGNYRQTTVLANLLRAREQTIEAMSEHDAASGDSSSAISPVSPHQ